MRIVIKDVTEVTNQLAKLGTSKELLVEVMVSMVAARRECTDNDPAGTRGYRSWQMGSRRLRDLHIGLSDWQKDDTDQVPSVVSRARGLRIVVCNTDDGTCREQGDGPQNRSKKGAATDRAVDDNAQFTMPFMTEPPSSVIVLSGAGEITSVGRVTTYYLCVFENGDDVRCELSCPTTIENGFFSGFGQRIFILGGDSGNGEPAKKVLPGEPEYKITVEKKKK